MGVNTGVDITLSKNIDTKFCSTGESKLCFLISCLLDVTSPTLSCLLKCLSDKFSFYCSCDKVNLFFFICWLFQDNWLQALLLILIIMKITNISVWNPKYSNTHNNCSSFPWFKCNLQSLVTESRNPTNNAKK